MREIVESAFRKRIKDRVNEAKNVGILYHYTSYYRLKDIIKGNYNLKSSRGYISFTRFGNQSDLTAQIFRGLDVRLVIDGDKLSNRYKITPDSITKVDGEILRDKDTQAPMYKTGTRNPGEERYYGESIDVSSSLIQIDIRFNEYDMTRREMEELQAQYPNINVVDSFKPYKP